MFGVIVPTPLTNRLLVITPGAPLEMISVPPIIVIEPLLLKLLPDPPPSTTLRTAPLLASSVAEFSSLNPTEKMFNDPMGFAARIVPLFATVWVTLPTPMIIPELVLVMVPLLVPFARSVPPAKLNVPRLINGWLIPPGICKSSVAFVLNVPIVTPIPLVKLPRLADNTPLLANMKLLLRLTTPELTLPVIEPLPKIQLALVTTPASNVPPFITIVPALLIDASPLTLLISSVAPPSVWSVPACRNLPVPCNASVPPVASILAALKLLMLPEMVPNPLIVPLTFSTNRDASATPSEYNAKEPPCKLMVPRLRGLLKPLPTELFHALAVRFSASVALFSTRTVAVAALLNPPLLKASPGLRKSVPLVASMSAPAILMICWLFPPLPLSRPV